MRIFLASLVLFCVVTTLAAPSKTTSHVVHERRAANPGSDWTLNRRLSPTDSFPSPLRIGLKQANLHRLEDLLLSISHPVSPTYGQHWSPEKVKDYFAPSLETIDVVRGWLDDNRIGAGRVKVSKSKGWIEVSGLAVGEVEELLGAEYHVFEHESGAKQVSCESYSVPEHVREHIDLIKPTVHFIHAPLRTSSTPSLSPRSLVNLGMPAMDPGPKTNGKKVTAVPQAGVANCDEMITLDCLRALYSIDYTPVATDKNSFGIVELTPQAFLAGDLDVFFSNFSPSQVGQRPTLISIDGGIAQTENQSFNFNGESSLDLEYGIGLTNPQPVTLLQTGDTVEGGSFDNWLDAVDGSFCTFEGGDDPDEDGIYPDPLPGGFKGNESCGIVAPPNVISTSYGQDEVTFTPAYVQRQCAEYGKLGMMGTTVIYSSGDRGVAGRSGCLNAGPPSANGIGFSPQFPVVCPFVTAVGATQIVPTKTVNDPESACETVIFSGGGFSNVFPMPSYQSDAVTKFLTDTPPPYTAAQFNNSGKARGYPDLSANGANYVIGVDGTLSLVFGTSASAPVTASIITLINDARIAAGKSSVGFINPAIYSTDFAGAFNDITNGTNQGCGTVGFSAVPNWDPVTGVGTPNLTALIPLFLALP